MRRQLPVYSPIRLDAIVTAAAALRDRTGARSALERYLSEEFHAKRVILTSSGTHALQLALAGARPLGPMGRVVALPGYSCFDLVSAAVGAGVRVRFYDVDPITLCPDLESLRLVLREGVSAVVAGSLYGYPLDWADLRAECDGGGVELIEDAAQGVGTRAGAEIGGAIASATVLSFGRGKGWTGGGGGALLLRESALELPDRVKLTPPGRGTDAKAVLLTLAAWVFGRPVLYRIPTSVSALGLGETQYHAPTPPGVISAFSAALALGTALQAQDAVEGRRRAADRWSQILDTMPEANVVRPCRPVGGTDAATFLRYAIVARDRNDAVAFCEAGRDLGVAAGYPVALHRLEQAGSLISDSPPPLPGSERLAEALITLPTHAWVTDADVASLSRLVSGMGG